MITGHLLGAWVKEKRARGGSEQDLGCSISGTEGGGRKEKKEVGPQ